MNSPRLFSMDIHLSQEKFGVSNMLTYLKVKCITYSVFQNSLMGQVGRGTWEITTMALLLTALVNGYMGVRKSSLCVWTLL